MTIHKLTFTISLACLLIASSGPSKASQPSDPQPPDLCSEPVRGVTGEPYTDTEGTTISRFCPPRINPPVLDQEVCCSISDKATCTLPDAVGRCTSGMKFWCEHGQASGGKIECYQDAPDACAAGVCQPATSYTGEGAIFDDTSWLCCHGNDDEYLECVYVGESSGPPVDHACSGKLLSCMWGATNEDGTVDCLY